jgi:hypothetical protein
MWQEFAKHGLQTFSEEEELRTRMQQINVAIGRMCDRIAETAARTELQGIQRAISLRSKPEGGGKSLYECLNQLIHYWYCCAAGLHLFDIGYTTLHMRPTAEDNVSTESDVYDVVAFGEGSQTVVAEVFCVSTSLWSFKMSRTLKKLQNAPAECLRFVYYNLESKPKYRSKRYGISFYGVSSPSAGVTLVNNPLTEDPHI